jgi:predicted ATPase
LTLARQLSHPFSLSFALYFAAVIYQYLQQVQATQEHAEALMALSTEQGFRQRLAQGRILLGWALVEQSRVAAGIAQMRQSVAAYGATGADLGRSSYLALLAEAYGKEGHAEEGLAVLAEALAVVDEHGIRFNEAELYRLKGELLLRQPSERGSWLMASAEPFTLPEVKHPVLTEAETCFRQALDTASHQQAKSLELRAATSLGRLWQQQGKRGEASELLTPIYGWFTEGFDTADLQEAKALLEELA